MRHSLSKGDRLVKRLGKRRPRLEVLERRELLAVFSVTNPNDSGPGSLREAIQLANSNAGFDQIEFRINGSPVVVTISILSPLPSVTEAASIDGTTQAGFSFTPVIELDGGGAGAGADGLRILVGGSTVRGLAINRFGGAGIVLSGSGGSSIISNHIGVDPSGTQARPNGGPGVLVDNSAGNSIGSLSFGFTNVLSGNLGDGVLIQGSSSTNNQVLSNRVGADLTGSTAIGNGSSSSPDTCGIRISGGASQTFVAFNTVSGNVNAGICVENNASLNTIAGNSIGIGQGLSIPIAVPNQGPGVVIRSASSNVVQGNDISANAGPGVAIVQGSSGNSLDSNMIGTQLGGNLGDGVFVDQSPNNLVGDPNDLDSNPNVIAGNQRHGVFIQGSSSVGNLVAANFIGVFSSSATPLPNLGSGVRVEDASDTTIGGASPLARNVISGNSTFGIHLKGEGALRTLIVGNIIGLDDSQTTAVPNDQAGIVVEDAPSNTIGGGTTSDGNVVSGNRAGVIIFGSGASGNRVSGNRVGVDFAGTTAFGNSMGGVFVLSAPSNTIGGTGLERNVISGNLGNGVVIAGDGATDTIVSANVIGTDVGGSTAIPNSLNGIFVGDAAAFTGLPVTVTGVASDATIGGISSAEANIISGNGGEGVLISADAATKVAILGNFIGTNSSGLTAIPNGGSGVFISAQDNSVGGSGAGEGNLISGNARHGVEISGADAVGNKIQGNLIGVDLNRTTALGNSIHGVAILGGATDNTVGGFFNLISGNGGSGVDVRDSNTARNSIAGNMIGVDDTGSVAIPNRFSGVVLQNSSDNTVGGSNPSDSNLISGNGIDGVSIIGTLAARNLVLGNLIGTDETGASAIPNRGAGVLINDGEANTIGGRTPASRNVISGNLGEGVNLSNPDSSGPLVTGNQILGNFIGTDAQGSGAVPNRGGIFLDFASNMTLSDNVVSGNTGAGIQISRSTNLTIDGNTIGLDATGATALANTRAGLILSQSADFILFANVVSANDDIGILLANSSRARIQANRIGVDRSGNRRLGNRLEGLSLRSSSSVTIGGTTSDLLPNGGSPANVVSGNGAGIQIAGGSGILIQSNLVGLDLNGVAAIANNSSGITLTGATDSTIGGAAAVAGNFVSANSGDGISLRDASRIVIQGNVVGLNQAGARAGNGRHGILLENSSQNTIGGVSAGEGNLLSGNVGSGALVVNGSSQNVFQANRVGIDGSDSIVGNGEDGLAFDSSSNNQIGGSTSALGNTLSGNVRSGLSLTNGSAGNTISGNLVGLDGRSRPSSNGNAGILLDRSSNNLIGGASGSGNVLSGNAKAGLALTNNSARNTISGNTVGLDLQQRPVPNREDGVILVGSSDNRITGNVISGNQRSGLSLTAGSARNLLDANLVGVNLPGTEARPNAEEGILISASGSNTVGGATPGMGNVISGNLGVGLAIEGALSSNNVVLGNTVGLGGDGSTRLRNALDGIFVDSAVGTTIGSGAAGSGNVVSGNGSVGIQLFRARNSLVAGNRVGTNAQGTVALPNRLVGIFINESANNTIGAATPSGGNLVSGNGSVGLQFEGAGSTRNLVIGNIIGLDASGSSALGNEIDGVFLNAPGNTIGGAAAGEANVISGNGSVGVDIFGQEANGNFVVGNIIGLDATGAEPIPNRRIGVLINESSGNTVGGAIPGAGNVISSNLAINIEISGDSATGNAIVGNLIGSNRSGNRAVGRNGTGVFINGSPGNRVGGNAPADSNLFLGHASSAIQILGASGSGNLVTGNRIGDPNLVVSRDGNTLGVFINDAPNNTIGGATPLLVNVIQGNLDNTIRVSGPNAVGNDVSGNIIGGVTVPPTGPTAAGKTKSPWRTIRKASPRPPKPNLGRGLVRKPGAKRGSR